MRGFEFVLRVESVPGEFGIAEFEDHAVGFDLGTGMKNDAIDMGIGLRRNPLDVFGDKGADAADVANHGAALDFVGPDGGFVDGRSRRAKTGDAEGDASKKDGSDRGVDDATYFFGTRVGWALDVHDLLQR